MFVLSIFNWYARIWSLLKNKDCDKEINNVLKCDNKRVCFLRESVELARNSLETLSYINRLFTVSHWVKQTSKGARFVAKVEALAGLQRKFTWYLFNNKWLLDKYILWQLWSFALGSYIYSGPSFVGVVRLLPLLNVFLFNLRCSPDYILFTQYFSIFRQGVDIMMMFSELTVKCTK